MTAGNTGCRFSRPDFGREKPADYSKKNQEKREPKPNFMNQSNSAARFRPDDLYRPLRNRAGIIAPNGLLDDAAHPPHGFMQHLLQAFEMNTCTAAAATGGMIGDEVDGRVRNLHFASQYGFRHAGHADDVSAIALVAVDLRRCSRRGPCVAA